MLHHNKSHNSDADRERGGIGEGQTERVDSRSVKGCVYARGTGTMLSVDGVFLSFFLWGEAKCVQLAMANVSKHLTGNEQELFQGLLTPSFRLRSALHTHARTVN